MGHRCVSTDFETILDAVSAVMECVPLPWTRVMVEDAVDAVLHFADEWRGLAQWQEIDKTLVANAYLARRLGLTRRDASTLTVVAE